jgi:hypothetical protein
MLLQLKFQKRMKLKVLQLRKSLKGILATETIERRETETIDGTEIETVVVN